MLDRAEAVAWARRFGVAERQVHLDHLLSHLLGGIGALGAPAVLIGGTALCRTHLVSSPWTRLSEDLDLMVVGDLPEVAAMLERRLPREVRREYPDAGWVTGPTQARPPAPALLSAEGVIVRVQLLPTTGAWASWAQLPVEHRGVDLRYLDTSGSVALRVPTLPGFAAMKIAAWEDRHAERDLFDLAAMAQLDAFGAEALAVFTRLAGRPPELSEYRRLPASTRTRWRAQLAHQTPVVPDPEECLTLVARALGRMLAGG